MRKQSMTGCDICEILPTIPPELVIAEDEWWSANLGAQDQTNLGRTYITLKRHASELDELTAQEDASFITIRNGLIRAIRQQFSPLTFNLSCLKNDAFKQEPDNTPPSAAHVHWHLIPRYDSTPVVFAGETFLDPSPGRYLAPDRERKPVSPTTALHIASAIRANYSA